MRSRPGSAGDFPYHNLSLKSLPGEKWKDIPDFEELYKVSNFGRVKSLRREGVRFHGGIYIIQERIRKAKLDVKRNKTIDVPLYTLTITLNRDGGKYHFSIGRLVYCLFIKKFNLEDHSVYISYKDNDGRNLHVSNLIKSDISTIKLLSYEKGRAISHLTILSKPVTQFDTQGRPVQHYPSMYEAARLTGFTAGQIAEAAHGKTHICKGSFWRFGRQTRNLKLDAIKRKAAPDHVHKDLMKRLGIRKINNGNLPPYLNLSNENMNGERWKDIPGYDGLYKVSNLGRIKRLQRVTTGKQQKWMPEQIKRLTVDFRPDKSGKEVPGSTLITLAKDRKKVAVSVSRLVYYLFVKKFNLSDHLTRVYYRDGNPLNCHYKNLFLQNAVWSITK